MSHQQIMRRSHQHRFFVDANTGDLVCLCGNKKGDKAGSKYHNKSTVYNGINFHSAFEASYAAELDWRVKAGDIKSWERQVKLDLKVNGQHITNYYIDFIVLHNDGKREFTEVKGLQTEAFIMKWRILEATFEDHKKSPDDFMTIIKQQKSRFYRT